MSENALVGRATYINGDVQEFTDAEEYIQCIREELRITPLLASGLKHSRTNLPCARL